MTEAAPLHASARALYEQRQYAPLDELLAPLDERELEAAPYLGFWLADAWRRLGRQPNALALVEKISVASRRSGIPRLELDRLNLEGMLRFETGDIRGAESLWRELLARAGAESSAEFSARANNNLGIICTLQARTPEAVMCYQRALSAYHAIGAQRGLAQSHQNLAITYRELERFDSADDHFAEAMRFARSSGSEDELARAEQERALLIYVARRDAGLARASVRRALARFAALNDPGGISDASRVVAMIELGEGNLHATHEQADKALAWAREVGHLLLEAELLEVLAAAARKEGNEGHALTIERAADATFARLHAPVWGLRLRQLMSRL
ncbi:MAG: tetratricopeptide repeat protein [Gemmatimonadota bacterium]